VNKVPCILILSLFILLYADQEVRGSVVKDGDRYPPPVDSATIVIKWGVWSDSTYSNKQGFYNIKSPATGVHNVQAYKWINNEFWISEWQQVRLKSDDWKWVSLCLKKKEER